MSVYYVSSLIGSDKNTGTSSTTAFSTLQAAANVVKPGDKVEVMNGTYTGPYYGDLLNINASGMENAPITFEAASGQTPVLDSSGSWAAIHIQASYINIIGLTIIGGATKYTQAYALANADVGSSELNGNGIFVSSSDGKFLPNHITIQNNVIFNEPGAGIAVLDADYIQILNNVVHDNAHWSSYGSSGIGVGASKNSDSIPGVHVLISGNTSYNNAELVPEYRAGAITDGEGIILDTNPDFIGSFVIQNNTTWGNSGPGIESFLTDNALITGNTVGGDLTNPSLVYEGEIFINQSKNNVVANNTVTSSPPSFSGSPWVPSTGSNSGLVINVAEDAYLGDAKFIVTVDGEQVGGTYTAFASQRLGQTQSVPINATLTSGTHNVAITFINDLYEGTASTDRNLYVTSATYNGVLIAEAQNALYGNWTNTFQVISTSNSMHASSPEAPATVGSNTPSAVGTRSLALNISEDSYQGDAKFVVLLDGVQFGGIYTATASYSQGASQSINLGTFADSSMPHRLGVTFLNDQYLGNALSDRNLYVDSIQIGDKTLSNGSVKVGGAGEQIFTLTPGSSNTHDLTLLVSEDAYQGDAQFTVKVDGRPVGEVFAATAIRSLGQVQAFTLGTILESATPHEIAVSFLNDKFGGTASTDRNLFVENVQVDGKNFGGAAMTGNGTQNFSILVSAS